MPNKTKPAVGYIRMSTDKQEDSPKQQKAEIIKLAKRHGYRIIRWYEDHAISGAKTHKRKQFRQMILDAEDLGDFQAILCWDQDRFGRFDSIEAGEWISPLRRANVELVTVVQGRINWDDFAGRIIYQITQEGKHSYLVDISKNVLRGMIRFAKKGHMMGMPTPYAYDRQYYNAAGKKMCRIRRREKFRKPKEWYAKLTPSADKKEVKTLKWLFNEYANTEKSVRALVVELNCKGVPSPSGGEWDFTYVKTLLRHPAYAGHLTYGRRRAGLYHNVGADGEIVSARSTRKDLENYSPVFVPNNHEALVDQETFDAVQAKLKARARTHGGPVRKYLLSGILRCGHCGSIMNGSGNAPSKKQRRYSYYKCKRSQVSGTCRSYSVRCDVIEEAVAEHFRAIWLSDNGQKVLRKAIKKAARLRQKERPNRLAEYESQLAALDRKITKGKGNLLLVDPEDMGELKQVLAGWRTERDEIKEKLETERTANQQNPELDADKVMAQLAEIEKHISDDCAPLAKTAFSRIFKSITLFWKPVNSRYYELEKAEFEAHFPFV